MTNRKAKGSRREKEARDIWIEAGWLVDFKISNKWHSDDLFTYFDFIAINGNVARLIQVKSNRSDFYKARKEITKWIDTNKISLDCVVMLKENYKDWRSCIVCKNYWTDNIDIKDLVSIKPYTKDLGDTVH